MAKCLTYQEIANQGATLESVSNVNQCPAANDWKDHVKNKSCVYSPSSTRLSTSVGTIQTWPAYFELAAETGFTNQTMSADFEWSSSLNYDSRTVSATRTNAFSSTYGNNKNRPVTVWRSAVDIMMPINYTSGTTKYFQQLASVTISKSISPITSDTSNYHFGYYWIDPNTPSSENNFYLLSINNQFLTNRNITLNIQRALTVSTSIYSSMQLVFFLLKNATMFINTGSF